MFKSKIFFSLSIFIFLLIITSVVKNQSRIFEKKISNLNSKILNKEKNLSETQFEFHYLTSPYKIEKKIINNGIKQFKPIEHSKIFNSIDDFNQLKKKFSNLKNINEKKDQKK
tara:strand:- start:71 stop:409 length:339 start_codon:yes stop_codon:yes gene_type:complete